MKFQADGAHHHLPARATRFSFVSLHPVQRGGAGHGKSLIAAVAFLFRNITITQQSCAISVRFGEAGSCMATAQRSPGRSA